MASNATTGTDGAGTGRPWWRRAGVWRVVGALLVALVVWFGAPLVSIGAAFHPFDPAWVRVLLLILILALWFGRRGWAALRARAASARLLDRLAAGGASGSPDAGADAEAQRRFRQAIEELKRQPSGPKAGDARRGRGRSALVHALPWYAIIGAPGSGKTTLLAHSGLRFRTPGAADAGQPLSGVGGTRSFDFWFAEEAVLIDTAGRYTTQDSDPVADSAHWRAFVRQLREVRTRQALNGALVTLSAADLYAGDSSELRRQAAAIRARLAELLAEAGHRLPIYVIVTKLDLLPGFVELFGDAERELRDRVLGLGLDDRPDGSGLDAGTLAERFGAIVTRIERMVPDRLMAEPDLRRRAAIAGFARQLAALLPALADTLAAAFGDARTPFPMPVRGVFLTSGTQEGTPIDRLLAAMTSTLGIERPKGLAHRPSGKSYFVNDLLRQHVLAEAHLAGSSDRWEASRRRVRMTVGAGLTSALVLVAGAWMWSYLANARYLAATHEQARTVERLQREQPVRADTPLAARIDRLGTLATLADADGVRVQAPPLGVTLGLFQGPKLADAAGHVYRDALAGWLEPQIMAQLRAILASGAEPAERRYAALNAYLVLHDRALLADASVDAPGVLRSWLASQAEQGFARGLDAQRRSQLLVHGDALVSDLGFSSRGTPDTALVSAARSALAAVPMAGRVYASILSSPSAAATPGFSLADKGGPRTLAVLGRASGVPLTEPVPAFFTATGYRRTFLPALENAVDRALAEQRWVLGTEPPATADAATMRKALADDVRQIYLNEYIARWQRLLADLALAKPRDAAHAAEIARTLGGPESPLPAVLRAIAEEVSLARTGAGLVDRALERAGKAAGDVLGTPAGMEARPERVVDERFGAFRDFVLGAGDKGEGLARLTAAFGEVHKYLLSVEAIGAAAAAPAARQIAADAARLPEPMRSMIGTFVGASSAQAAGAERQKLGQALAASVGGFCAKATQGRFPIDPRASVDITADDFARLFAPAGLIDEFFQKNLAAQVDQSRSPWQFRDAVSAGGPASLAPFERAAAIREAFFAGGQRQPSIRAQWRLLDADPSVREVRMDVDGQPLVFVPGDTAARPFAWPGPRGAQQLRVTVVTAAGEPVLMTEGPWAPLRLVERARIEPTAQPERFRVGLVIDGRPLSFEIVASGVVHPWRMTALRGYNCPVGL